MSPLINFAAFLLVWVGQLLIGVAGVMHDPSAALGVSKTTDDALISQQKLPLGFAESCAKIYRDAYCNKRLSRTSYVTGKAENFDVFSTQSAGRRFPLDNLLNLWDSGKNKELLLRYPQLLQFTVDGKWVILPTPKYYKNVGDFENPHDVAKKGFVVGAWRVPPQLLNQTIFADARVRNEHTAKSVAIKAAFALWQDSNIRCNVDKRRATLDTLISDEKSCRNMSDAEKRGLSEHILCILNEKISFEKDVYLPITTIGDMRAYEEENHYHPTPIIPTDLKERDKPDLELLKVAAQNYLKTFFGAPKNVLATFHLIATPGLHCHFRVNMGVRMIERERELWLDDITGHNSVEAAIQTRVTTQKFWCRIVDLEDVQYAFLKGSGFQVDEPHSKRARFFDDLKDGEIPLSPHVWDEANDPEHRHWAALTEVKKIMQESGCEDDIYTFMHNHQDSFIPYQGQHVRICDIPRVLYLTPHDAQRYEVFFDEEEKKWFCDNDDEMKPCKNSGKDGYEDYYAFVIHKDGRMFMHDYEAGHKHHVLTTGGEPVIFSGMVKIDEDSNMVNLAVVSGHYNCGFSALKTCLERLQSIGVDVNSVAVDTNASFTGITKNEQQQLKEAFNLKCIFKDIRKQ